MTEPETPDLPPPPQVVKVDMSWLQEALGVPAPDAATDKERLLGEFLAELEKVDLAGREHEWKAAMAQLARTIFTAGEP